MNDKALKAPARVPHESPDPFGFSWRWDLIFVIFLSSIVISFWSIYPTVRRPEASQIEVLSTQIELLTSEIHSLRQVVSANTEVEIIFLKILYLYRGSKPMDIELARKIATSIQKHCSEFKKDPDLILSIMVSESNFDPKAVSYMGAVGLMQIMPQWKGILNLPGDLTDVDTNIHYGLLIYGFYKNMYQDVTLALTAYNRGPSRVDWDLINKRDPSANGYAIAVLARYEQLKSLNP